jgi:hypothetical protein
MRAPAALPRVCLANKFNVGTIRGDKPAGPALPLAERVYPSAPVGFFSRHTLTNLSLQSPRFQPLAQQMQPASRCGK